MIKHTHIKKIHNLDNYFHCAIKLNYATRFHKMEISNFCFDLKTNKKNTDSFLLSLKKTLMSGN